MPEDVRPDAFPHQFARTRRFSLGAPRGFLLSPGGGRLLFLRSRGGEDPETCLYRVGEDGVEHLLADPAALPGAGDGGIPEAERIRRIRAREHATGITAFTADAALDTAAFTVGGVLWTVPADGSAAPRPLPSAGPATAARIDPTGRRIAYVTGGALHTVELAAPHEDRALAVPESAEVSYGLAEHVAAESMGRRQGCWWAPDGRRLLVARVDTAPVQRWWIADPANPDRAPQAIRYPAAGTANADVSLHLVDAETGARTEVRWDRAAFEYLPTVGWDAHGPLLSVQSRDQRTLRVLAADPDTGETVLLHEQTDPAWVELISGSPLRTAGGALVTTVDDGETRRLAVDGKPVTGDGLQVRELLGADGESVYFTATGEPTETHVWRRDGGGEPVRLTEEPGVHTAFPAAGGAYVLDSRTEDGRRAVLVRGASRTPLASRAAEPVLTPNITWLRAGSRQLRTALLLPRGHTPGTRLPLLLCPYAGPAMQVAVRVRGPWFLEAQWFAEQGFAVLIADGSGTPGRGPAWEKEVHRDTLSTVLDDQVTAVHAAAEHCPDIDLGRVAIRGWSYGGTLAAAAVLRRPDVFHAAVSGAAPSDQRLYDTHWRERFLGLPQEHPEDYARSSPISEAAALRRPLLLVHGLADDNVVAAHTLRMSAALLSAGRPHGVLPLSGAGHSPVDGAAAARLLGHQLAFLREALADPEELPET